MKEKLTRYKVVMLHNENCVIAEGTAEECASILGIKKAPFTLWAKPVKHTKSRKKDCKECLIIVKEWMPSESGTHLSNL